MEPRSDRESARLTLPRFQVNHQHQTTKERKPEGRTETSQGWQRKRDKEELNNGKQSKERDRTPKLSVPGHSRTN